MGLPLEKGVSLSMYVIGRVKREQIVLGIFRRQSEKQQVEGARRLMLAHPKGNALSLVTLPNREGCLGRRTGRQAGVGVVLGGC